MLIKLCNEFYQVQCDVFGDLVIDLFDIWLKIFCVMLFDEKKLVNLSVWFYGDEMGVQG